MGCIDELSNTATGPEDVVWRAVMVSAGCRSFSRSRGTRAFAPPPRSSASRRRRSVRRFARSKRRPGWCCSSARRDASVSPKPAKACSRACGPRRRKLPRAFDALTDLRERPAGLLRLSVPRVAVPIVIEPALADFRRAYPDVAVDIDVDDGVVDLTANNLDAGIRIGERSSAT